MADELDLVEIRARAEAITPGAWSEGHFSDDAVNCDCRYIFGGDYMGAIGEVYVSDGKEGTEHTDNPPPAEAKANLVFIAHAPTDIKSLLAECERLRTQLALKDKALREVEYCNRSIPDSAGRIFPICPICRGVQPLFTSGIKHGHTSECLLAQALSPSMTDAK